MADIRPELMRRIVWEASAVEAKFLQRFVLRRDQVGRPAWVGHVPVEGQDVPTRVIYPAAYPGVAPIVKTGAALPAHCPHLLERSTAEATLCWIAPMGGRGRARWDPQRHTAATAMRAAQRWYLALLVWQALGIWPVPDAWDLRN